MTQGIGPIQLLGMAFAAIVLLLSYAILPYIGGGVLIFIDYAAYAFRWLGCSVPWVAWVVLGGVAGGLAGLNVSRRRLGMPGTSPRIMLWGGGAFAFLYLLTFLYCHVMKPVTTGQAAVAPVPAPAASTTTPMVEQ